MSQMYPVHIIQSDFFRYFPILAFQLHLSVVSVLFPLGFLTKILYTLIFSLMQAAHTTHLFLLDLNVPVSHKGTYYQAPHYEFLPSPPISCCLSSPTIILSPCSQTHSVYGLPLMVHILLCDLITGEILHKTQLCYCMTLHNHIMSHSNKAVSNRTFTQLWSLLDVGDQVSRPHKTEGKIIAGR